MVGAAEGQPFLGPWKFAEAGVFTHTRAVVHWLWAPCAPGPTTPSSILGLGTNTGSREPSTRQGDLWFRTVCSRPANWQGRAADQQFVLVCSGVFGLLHHPHGWDQSALTNGQARACTCLLRSVPPGMGDAGLCGLCLLVPIALWILDLLGYRDQRTGGEMLWV